MLNSVIETLAKEAESRRVEIEDGRIIPYDLMSRVKESGLIKLWATKSCGGSQIPVSEMSKIISQVAYYNGSLAWVIGVTESASLLSGYLPHNIAHLLFDSPNAMVGGFAVPSGQAVKSGDELLVSGHWSWGSGIKHCTHIVAGVLIIDEGQKPYSGLIFFEPDEITFLDNWHVHGLKGTNSIDYTANKISIPKNRWVQFPITESTDDHDLYKFSYLGALSISVASVALGLAERALSEALRFSQTKKSFGMGKPLALKPEIQQEVGRIQGVYLSAKALLNSTIVTAERSIQNGTMNLEIKAQIRLSSCHSTSLSDDVVSSVYRLAGGSAIWQSEKIEELMRDIHVVTQHGMVSPSNYRTAGAVALNQAVPEILL